MTQLLRPREVCEILGISRQMAYKLATLGPDRGGVRAVHIGSAVRIPAEEIERIAHEGCQPR